MATCPRYGHHYYHHHRCGQEVYVLSWMPGAFWRDRTPAEREVTYGGHPLKGACTCGEPLVEAELEDGALPAYRDPPPRGVAPARPGQTRAPVQEQRWEVGDRVEVLYEAFREADRWVPGRVKRTGESGSVVVRLDRAPGRDRDRDYFVESGRAKETVRPELRLEVF